jgi:hypothetical protein
MNEWDGKSPDALSDAELIEAITEAGRKLWQCAKEGLAALGSVAEDPRWGSSPLPLRFELQLALLFLGALDAYDVVASLLRFRPSQQAFGGLRFQMESVAVIRWLVESDDPKATSCLPLPLRPGHSVRQVHAQGCRPRQGCAERRS